MRIQFFRQAVQSETAPSSSLLMELSLKKVPEGREQPDPVANDLRDCEHRYRQDGTRHAPHPIPEDQCNDDKEGG